MALVLEHAEYIIDCKNHSQAPKPLRLLLLGTAGTGKSTAARCMLQKLRERLKERGQPFDFVRVAAPTGTAAFNVRFNATTVHRLIHWLNPRYWSEIQDDVLLERLQTHL